MRGSVTGDLYRATAQIETPISLTSRQKELLRNLRKSMRRTLPAEPNKTGLLRQAEGLFEK